MSASLVGSEMCIRDSPIGAPPTRHAGGATWRGPGGGSLPRGSSGGSGGCLLYTSDAADDM
eukprot:7255453-Alexandrium_andersonii.AAC.1